MPTPQASLAGWEQAVPLLAEGAHTALLDTVHSMRQSATIYPPGGLEFNALAQTPFDAVKVVILGQDPYHGPGQAHGLSFSVPEGVRVPPSLRNMFKEIQATVYNGEERQCSTDLTRWAQQGVLLLNAIFTVEAGKAGSHRRLGWERISDAIVSAISDQHQHVVFLLWGSFARSKAALIDTTKHLVLEAAHPSPLSAYRGFFGCNHFALANDDLVRHGVDPIKW